MKDCLHQNNNPNVCSNRNYLIIWGDFQSDLCDFLKCFIRGESGQKHKQDVVAVEGTITLGYAGAAETIKSPCRSHFCL